MLRGHTGVAPTQCKASALHLSCHNLQKEWHLFPSEGKSEESLGLWLLQAEGFVLFSSAFVLEKQHTHALGLGSCTAFPPQCGLGGAEVPIGTLNRRLSLEVLFGSQASLGLASTAFRLWNLVWNDHFILRLSAQGLFLYETIPSHCQVMSLLPHVPSAIGASKGLSPA